MLTPRSRLLVGALFTLGLALLWVGNGPFADEPQHTDVLPPVFSRPQPESIDDLKAIEKQVQDVLSKIIPAVVGVRIGPVQGSGVIIDSEGHVLTAGHVSGKPGRNMEVILPDGKVLKAKTLGRNGGIDSGMIQIVAKGEFPHVAMGTSSGLKLGDWVLAIGHPGGFRGNRAPVVRVGRIIELNHKYIRTDCALVGGDSGGPLFDMQGRVIGIHSRIGESIAFNIHVPVNTYRNTWDRLASGEKFGGDQIEQQRLVRSAGGKIVFEKNGKLTTDGPRDDKHDGTFAQTYTIKMTPGALYTIDMVSRKGGPLDPYLRLEDSQGKQLVADDDGAGDQNARIVFRPSKADEYRIIATSAEPNQTGLYKILVRRQEMKLLAGKIDVLPALGVHKRIAQEAFGKLAAIGEPPVVSGQLFDAEGNVVAGKEIEFRWDSGDRKVKSDARGQVVLRLGNANVKQLFAEVPDGLKLGLLLADKKGNPFDYSLFLKDDFHLPKVKSAGGKLVLEKRDQITGSEPLDKLRADLRKEKKSACFHKVYTFKLSGGSTYTIDLESHDFDSYLRLEDPSGKEVAEDDDSAGTMNSRIVYTPETDGVYRIVVTTCDPNQTGSYRLAVYQNDGKKQNASRANDGVNGAGDAPPR